MSLLFQRFWWSMMINDFQCCSNLKLGSGVSKILSKVFEIIYQWHQNMYVNSIYRRGNSMAIIASLPWVEYWVIYAIIQLEPSNQEINHGTTLACISQICNDKLDPLKYQMLEKSRNHFHNLSMIYDFIVFSPCSQSDLSSIP